MSKKTLFHALKNYQKANKAKRLAYFKKFEHKMIYRTTKTENPETTPKMVKDVLAKLTRHET